MPVKQCYGAFFDPEKPFMNREDKAIGAERVGIMAMAARSAEKFAADFLEAAVQLPAVP